MQDITDISSISDTFRAPLTADSETLSDSELSGSGVIPGKEVCHTINLLGDDGNCGINLFMTIINLLRIRNSTEQKMLSKISVFCVVVL